MDKGLSRSQQIGQRIAATRLRHGWSIQDLSEHTNGAVSRSRLANFEAGLRRPDIEVVEILADVFGDVSAAWLLTLENGPETKSVLPEEKRPTIGMP